MKKSNDWIMAKHFDLEAMASNLEAILEASTSQEIKDGRQWYQNCNSFARGLAEKYGHGLEKIVGIISSLSPETKFNQNILDTIKILEYGQEAIVTTYDNNRNKALKILEDELEPHTHYEASTNKTAAFYFNILRPREASRVTIDRHSSRVCHGYYLTSQEAIYYSNTPAKYKATQEAYFIVARDHGLLPHILQAITWLTYRRTIVPKRYQSKDLDFNDIIL